MSKHFVSSDKREYFYLMKVLLRWDTARINIVSYAQVNFGIWGFFTSKERSAKVREKVAQATVHLPSLAELRLWRINKYRPIFLLFALCGWINTNSPLLLKLDHMRSPYWPNIYGKSKERKQCFKGQMKQSTKLGWFTRWISTVINTYIKNIKII